MRLWHIDLIPYLPKSQLLAQWRELNSIFKKEDKHVLINYIYNYSKEYLYYYSNKVINEMTYRGYKIKSWSNYNTYFVNIYHSSLDLIFEEHNTEYLKICYYNLKEKYIRGQKDFDIHTWIKLRNFINNKNLFN